MEQSPLEPLSSCPVCLAGGILPFLRVKDHTVSQETFSLTVCSRCSFCFTNPRPTPGSIGRYYEAVDYISHGGRGGGIQETLYRWIRRRAIRGKHRLMAPYFPLGKVLDLGCGTGEFLSYLIGRGYQCTGVEPSLRAREQAIRNHALEVLPDIGHIPAQEQFQVVTLWHVLEHLHDPKEELRRIHARMSSGGLLMLAVPDRESWDAQHYGSNWAAYDVPRHLSHFRRSDIRRLLVEQGFELLSTRGMWFDAPYVGMLSERHRGTSPVFAFIQGSVMGCLSNLVALFSSKPTSSSLFVSRKS